MEHVRLLQNLTDWYLHYLRTMSRTDYDKINSKKNESNE